MKSYQRFGLTTIASALMASTVLAADSTVTLQPVGAFGETLTSCALESFRQASAKAGRHVEYKDRFHGLKGTVPVGEYEAFLRCREGPLHTSVTATYSGEFAVVALRERQMLGETHLTIDLVAAGEGGAWWVRLVGVYTHAVYASQFKGAERQAVIGEPEPGTYIATVLSPTGRECVREIDLLENTRHWTFDAATCSYGLDRFAHLVPLGSPYDHQTSDWYRAMKAERESLLQELHSAAEKK